MLYPINNTTKELIAQYKDVFNGTGKVKDYKCELYINNDVPPVAQKLRRQPFHLRKQTGKTKQYDEKNFRSQR